MPRCTRAAMVALATSLLIPTLLTLPASARTTQPPDPRGEARATHQQQRQGGPAVGTVGVRPRPLFGCDDRVSGDQAGALHVRDGVTCLTHAKIAGPVTVSPGASLVAVGSTISGPVTMTGARSVLLFGNRIVGPLRANGGDWLVSGANTVVGPMHCYGNRHHGKIGLPDRAVPPWSGAKPVRTGDCAVA